MRERTGFRSDRSTVMTGLIGVGALLAASACNSLDEPASQPGSRTIIPVDTRPTQQALTKLPAISGGTLAASLDGRFAVAADPDRNRVSIVDLQTQAVSQIALEAGDEPGRVVTDALGHAYVALRRSGDVVRIDIASAQIQQRTHVCAAPRGMAVDPAGLLHVACADGHLTTLHAADGIVVRELDLNTDLRDVMVRGDHLLVSTFKSAALLMVDNAGTLGQPSGAIRFHVNVTKSVEVKGPDGSTGLTTTSTDQPMQPHLAWRTAQTPTGEVVMLHQGASEDVVDITKKEPDASQPEGGGSPYGGGSGQCGGIVTPAITMITADGQVTTGAIGLGPVSVDMAVSPIGTIAVVEAGAADPVAPRPMTIFDGDEAFASATAPRLAPPSVGGFSMGTLDVPPDFDLEKAGASSVMVIDRTMLGGPMVKSFGGCQFGSTLSVPGQATAVTFTARNELLVQSREPALITRVSFDGPTQSKIVLLGGDSVLDSGHEIFHRDAGGGIACASCHAEGAEDGHTWKFTGLGERRTQALHVGLEGTAPFHWSGDERDLGHLMEDVFVGRMGGVHQNNARLDALTDWLFALRPPAPSVDAKADAAVRGKALFESEAIGCTSCHTGIKLTNSKTVDVGTGGLFQVPSLVGVGYRAPLMHTGCAATLADRFDTACGGTKHGNVAGLNHAQIDDMVAYLRTL